MPRAASSPILAPVTLLGALFAAVALAPAQPVTIAVVDTGANVRVPALASTPLATYDVRTHGSDVSDPNGHGTKVASLIARSDSRARLLIIRAGSTSGAFSDTGEAAAIRYAVAHGARIINLSLGGSRTSSVERDAIRFAIAHGVLIVAAAGDDYANRPEYPAALLGSAGLAVAAVDASGARELFSNTGPWVSIAASGAHGTSFAAPLVSAAAARVWRANPALTARQVVAVVQETASGHGVRTDALGFGVLDVVGAVARATSRR
jgi:subtilisin family serine protease